MGYSPNVNLYLRKKALEIGKALAIVRLIITFLLGSIKNGDGIDVTF